MGIASRSRLCRLAARVLAASGVVGVLASEATAQGGPFLPPPPPPALCADVDARFAARMAFIEAKLALPVEQKPQWDAFVSSARDAEKPFRELCKAPPPPPPPPHDPVAMLEARDRMASMGAERHQGMHAAIARLKSALTSEQQRRLAEAILSQRADAGPWLPPPGGHRFGPGFPHAGPPFGPPRMP